jgi:hypothetical protein
MHYTNEYDKSFYVALLLMYSQISAICSLYTAVVAGAVGRSILK